MKTQSKHTSSAIGSGAGQNYLTVGAVMQPMKRILHQLKGWLAWKTKMCFKKKVFSSVN